MENALKLNRKEIPLFYNRGYIFFVNRKALPFVNFHVRSVNCVLRTRELQSVALRYGKNYKSERAR